MSIEATQHQVKLLRVLARRRDQSVYVDQLIASGLDKYRASELIRYLW